MPHPDNRPALAPALPGDTSPGRDHGWRDGNRHRWLFLFGDGFDDWRPVTVRAWWADDSGREVVQVEWWDARAMTTRGGDFLVNPAKIREG